MRVGPGPGAERDTDTAVSTNNLCAALSTRSGIIIKCFENHIVNRSQYGCLKRLSRPVYESSFNSEVSTHGCPEIVS